MSVGKKVLSWDTRQIVQYLADSLIESDEFTDEDEAFQAACEDEDIVSLEWESLCWEFGKLLSNVDTIWHIEVSNFGWRALNGDKVLHLDGKDNREIGQGALQEILPETNCTFHVHEHGENGGLAIQNFHHDSPYGREWYYLTPASDAQCEECAKLFLGLENEKVRKFIEEHEVCPECYLWTEYSLEGADGSAEEAIWKLILEIKEARPELLEILERWIGIERRGGGA